MYVDTLTMRADALTMRADALTMQEVVFIQQYGSVPFSSLHSRPPKTKVLS
jgi:hypothetical protein